MGSSLAELWDSRYLLRMLIARELKIRYKNSAFGFFWSVIPLFLDVVIYTFIVRSVLTFGAENYSAYLLCGLIPWLFMQNAVLDGSQSILAYMGIVRKIYMPREVFPIAIFLSNFIHFMLNWIVYFVAFLIVLPPFHKGIVLLPSMVWFPVVTLEMFLFVGGLCLWVSALNVFYEDIKFIVQTLFRLCMFLLPVIFPADKFYYSSVMRGHPWLFNLYMLNPIANMMDAYRHILLQPVLPAAFNLPGPALSMNWGLFAASYLISILVAVSGYAFFNRQKWRFLERG